MIVKPMTSFPSDYTFASAENRTDKRVVITMGSMKTADYHFMMRKSLSKLFGPSAESSRRQVAT